MVQASDLFAFFPLAITLHNAEEALWLPQWSKHAKKFHKPVNKDEFRFAVIIITLLAYLASCAFMFFPKVLICKYFYFGFLGAMIINIFSPHLIATAVLRKYCPGLITGAFLMMPCNSMIIWYSINNRIINSYEIAISTVVVGILLLVLIPVLFNLGRKLINYE